LRSFLGDSLSSGVAMCTHILYHWQWQYDTFHEQSYMCVPLRFYAKIFYTINSLKIKNFLGRKMDIKKTFLWKRNGQKWCVLLFLCSFGPKKHRKTPVFLSPLKNDPQQKWSVFKSEIVTANIFIGYQYLANQQQKTAWKSSYSTFLVGIPEVWKKS